MCELSRDHNVDPYFEKLKDAINKSIEQVYEKEWSLLEDKQILECAVAAQLFYYIKQDDLFRDLDVDSEYNKMLRGQTYTRRQLLKRINEKDDNGQYLIVRPDIIIHQRGPRGARILWVEVKLEWMDKPAKDLKKIIAVTRPIEPDAEYVTGYSYGVSIVFGDTCVKCTWVINGKTITGQRQSFIIKTTQDGKRTLCLSEDEQINKEHDLCLRPEDICS